MIYVGTAAWNIPKDYRPQFQAGDSLLQSYASRLPAVEINSSFYRHHQGKTYARWSESVPDDFRFSVKLAKQFTHEARLDLDRDAVDELKQVLGDYKELGAKLGCLLVQLPPSLDFQPLVADSFFTELRNCYSGPIAMEPRHISWTWSSAREFLRGFQLSRVWSDPAPIINPAMADFGEGEVAYFRLHGSPKIYKSNYDQEQLEFFQTQMQAATRTNKQVWCIFDNTAYGYATANALEIASL